MIDRERMNGRTDEPEIPPFVARLEEVEDASDPRAWDFWHVTPSGDDAKDYALGESYADIAIKLSRHRGDVGAITSALASIYLKQHLGLINAGALERGFIDRVAKRAVAGSLN
jgi:hypothetical protein